MILSEDRGHELVSVIDRVPGTLFLFTLLTVVLCFVCFWILVSKVFLRSQGIEDGLDSCFLLVRRRFTALVVCSIWVVVIAAGVVLVGKLIVPAILRDWSPAIDPAVSFMAFAIVVLAQVRLMPVFGVVLESNDVSGFECLSRAYSMTSKAWPWMIGAQVIIIFMLRLVDDAAGYLGMIPGASLPVFIIHSVFDLLVWAGLTIGSYFILTEPKIND